MCEKEKRRRDLSQVSKDPALDSARFKAQWPEIAGARVAPAREEGLTLELATEKHSVELDTWTGRQDQQVDKGHHRSRVLCRPYMQSTRSRYAPSAMSKQVVANTGR